MSYLSARFFQFAGVHSFLIGLLPFFIPVLLWQNEASIGNVALFIALTGLGFVVSLSLWERLFIKAHWRLLIALSLVFELLLVSVLMASEGLLLIVVAALLNGAYNCFYWTTQRVMFSAMTAEHEQTRNKTGKAFGDFQILVVVLLKLGILAGAFLLEQGDIHWVVLTSLLITLVSGVWFCRSSVADRLAGVNELLNVERAENLKPLSSFRFRDNHNSAIIFYLDGVFLFLESYFWVLSLFLITQENVMNLGLVVVTLTVFLSVVFFLIKNKIDALNPQKVFVFAVGMYAISWLLRAELDMDMAEYWKYPAIVLIAFLTTFFRLSFNKRFFDIARKQKALPYLLSKSYLSQAGIAIFFGGLACLAYSLKDTAELLTLVYWVAVPASLVYWAYLSPEKALKPTHRTEKLAVKRVQS